VQDQKTIKLKGIENKQRERGRERERERGEREGVFIHITGI
jgi:hypothetical protein